MNAERVASPCIDLCRMDAGSGLCLGCWRTLAEIAAWSAASDSARREILAATSRRRSGGAPRRDAASGEPHDRQPAI